MAGQSVVQSLPNAHNTIPDFSSHYFISSLKAGECLPSRPVYYFVINPIHLCNILRQPARTPLPVWQMALEQISNLPISKNGDNKLDPKNAGPQRAYSPTTSDVEKAGRGRQWPRFGGGDKPIGGRIAPVLPHLSNYDFADSDTGSDILGKQIELEAGNALQYRTCSWQKVRHFS
jgi:hypothetical protein